MKDVFVVTKRFHKSLSIVNVWLFCFSPVLVNQGFRLLFRTESAVTLDLFMILILHPSTNSCRKVAITVLEKISPTPYGLCGGIG